MRKEFKKFYILIITDNAEENVDAFYNDYNTAKK